MRYSVTPALILSLLLGCSGSDSTQQPTSKLSTANTMNSALTSSVASFMVRVPRFEGILVGAFNPGTPLAQGITMTPDLTGPPNSFTFTGPYDGNGDGFNETTVTGKATFASDPNVDWSGVIGQATVDVNIPILGHVYHADINFSITSDERQLSGTGMLTNPITGTTTTMTVPAATPLLIKPATGAGAVSNACGYSMEGPMRLEVTSSSGTLSTTWNFSFISALVLANNRTFTDSAGLLTTLPDTSVDTPCGGTVTINDWIGVYNQDWACLPRETGKATLTLSVTAADTVNIVDEDPPGSGDTSEYSAMTIGPQAHVLRGFFIGGPPGFHYREDFNWTMRKSLSGFAQISSYEYIEGPNMGRRGICVASAPRA
jgi:hypothetical protein